jgi:predicted nucleic acid-binding protein
MTQEGFTELLGVAQRDHILPKVNKERLLALLQRLKHEAIWTPGILNTVGATPDPKDDMLVSAALEAEAEFIVTWDKALLNMGGYDRVRFVDPETFVSIVRQRNDE